MMVRQSYESSNETTIALYCKFLEDKASDYEWISFIMDDGEKLQEVQYYTMEKDIRDDTYNVFFHNLDITRVHDVKVVAKPKHSNEFEVGNLSVYCVKKDSAGGYINIQFENNINYMLPPPVKKIKMPDIKIRVWSDANG